MRKWNRRKRVKECMFCKCQFAILSQSNIRYNSSVAARRAHVVTGLVNFLMPRVIYFVSAEAWGSKMNPTACFKQYFRVTLPAFNLQFCCKSATIGNVQECAQSLFLAGIGLTCLFFGTLLRSSLLWLFFFFQYYDFVSKIVIGSK